MTVNRPKRNEAYFKPERLRLELNKLFNVRPVLTPQHAWLQLRAMREEDGTRTLSVSQAGSVRALAKGKVCEGCELTVILLIGPWKKQKKESKKGYKNLTHNLHRPRLLQVLEQTQPESH